MRFPETKLIPFSNTKNAKTQKLFEIQLQLGPFFMVVQLFYNNMELQNNVWNFRYIIKSSAIKKSSKYKNCFFMFLIEKIFVLRNFIKQIHTTVDSLFLFKR